jgi:hypothetical protein
MDKYELLKALEDGREQFMTLIEELTDEQLQMPGVVGEWSIKDILIHISRWEAELVKLLWQVQQKLKPASILLNNVNVDEINERWYQESQARPLRQVLDDFESVRLQTMLRVEDLSDPDLLESKRFFWMQSDPLWKWIAANSYEHDAEHAESIHRWIVSRLVEE